MFPNRTMGYSISDRMQSRLAVEALINAVARRGVVAGWMGRVGAAGNNAATENFFSLLQKNILNRQPWRTREYLRIAIAT